MCSTNRRARPCNRFVANGELSAAPASQPVEEGGDVVLVAWIDRRTRCIMQLETRPVVLLIRVKVAAVRQLE